MFILTLLLALSLSLCIVYRCKQKMKSVCAVWIVAYLWLMLYSTVIGRTPHESCSIHLMPLWSIQTIQEGHIETLYEKIYNVLFFIPYGLLLGTYPQPLPKVKGVLLKRTVLIGFLTSVGIELLQLITRTGTCETDDVICNTLGAFWGRW